MKKKTIDFEQNYLVIELTNNCILNCTHCIQHLRNHKHFKKRGFMQKKLITKLLEDLKKSNLKFDALVLFWLGEPLLHPQFKEIYKTLLLENKKNNLFNKIEVHTNGYLLNKKIISTIFEYNNVIQRWHFSLDAITAQTYKKIKGKDYYTKIQNNIKRLIQKKKEKRSKYPQIVLQFIIEKTNNKEAKLFSDYWKNYLNSLEMNCETYGHFVPNLDKDCIFFRQLDCLDQANQKEANILYEKTLEEIKTTPPTFFNSICSKLRKCRSNICSGPWKSPVISWNGDITVCTNDVDLKLKIGNIKDQKFSEIWWENKKLGTLRRMLIKNQLKRLICYKCIIPQSSNYTGITEKELSLYKKWEEKNG